MKSWLKWMPLTLTLLSVAASAATEIGVITLVEGGARLLRGATWFKVVPGTRVEEGDILEAPERGQAQVEFAVGPIADLVGSGQVYIVAASAKTAPTTLQMPNGWLKVVATPPGLRLRTLPFDLVLVDAVLVVRANGPAVDFFVEAGSASLIEPTSRGADGTARSVKAGQYGSKSASGAIVTLAGAPKAFTDALPKHFVDALPVLAATLKAKPTLVIDHEITYAEAEPWLVGRDRAVFERRFTSRLRDPAFRSAVAPNVARYPVWDRMLNPQKYEPKEPPTTAPAK